MLREKFRTDRLAGSPRSFWQNPVLLVAIVLLSSAPLLLATVPPLVDLPGHMARYKVQLDEAALAHFYRHDWSLIGNLGVDLLIIPLAKLIGIEAGVKLIVMTIPALTAAGFLWVAHEVHGRIPPTAFFALPFAYNFPFFFGFVNFSLSMAFAVLAFALWLRLGRLERLRQRAAIFVPLSIALWLTHAFGWGVLGVLAFSAELVRQYDRGHGLIGSAWRSAVQCLSLTLPFLLMLAWRSGDVGGQTFDWFDWHWKQVWLEGMLRDRWEPFDRLALLISATVIALALVVRHFHISRNLVASSLFLWLVYLLLPRVLFGSAYADMRLAPFLVAFPLLAIRLDSEAHPWLARTAAVAALAFFVVRTGGTAASIRLYGQSWDRELAALEHLPRGARLASFVGTRCGGLWEEPRLEHLPGLATVRRGAFSNDQWVMAGAQPIKVVYRGGGRFTADPSQMVTARPCRGERWLTIEETLRTLPRDGFDYVWLINPPPHDPRLVRGMQPIWRKGRSVLYKIVDRTPPPESR
jgi:hypothetical protein